MFFKKINSKLTAFAKKFQSPLLLLIRLFWGGSFALGGLRKFGNIENVCNYFVSLGIPYPMLNAYLAASCETIGGIFLFLGLASRWAAIPLIIVMAVAFSTAELDDVRMLFSNPQKFTHSDPFNFLFAALLVFAFGPGKFSLDRWIAKKEPPSMYE